MEVNHEAQFNSVVKQIKEGPQKKLSNEVRLNFYKLYKQAVFGDVTGS